MIGERTNVTGSPRFARLIKDGNYDEARRGRAPAGRGRRQHPRRVHGRGHARRRGGDDAVPQPDRHRARHRARAGDGRQLEVLGHRGRPRVPAGQGRRQLDRLKEGEEEFLAQGADRPPLRRGGRRDGVRRDRPGRPRSSTRSRSASAPTGSSPSRSASRPRTSSSTRTSSRSAPGIEEHDDYAVDFIEATRGIKRDLPGREGQRRRLQPVVLVPRQRPRARGDARGLPLPRDRGRPRHGHRQRRPARGLRGDRAGAARARSRTCSSTAGPDATERPGRARRDAQGQRAQARRSAGPGVARGAGRGAPRARAGPRHRRLHRRRRRGGASAATRGRSTSSRAR